MDFESPDVAKDFPGLFASESTKKNLSRDSDYSDDEKLSRKDLLGKRKERKESKKDKGYVPFAGENSDDELDETKSPSRIKKTFTFLGKERKEKRERTKGEKDAKEKKEEEKNNIKGFRKDSKKESKKVKNKNKEDKKKPKEDKDKKYGKAIKKDKKKKSSEQFSEERPIFGIPLEEAIERSKSHDGIEIPVIVRECLDYIEEHGLACEDIYKISGVKSKVRQLKCQYNRYEKVYLYEHEPHVVASLLKQFLRDLPEPILTTELGPKFEDAAAIGNEPKKVEIFLKLLESLPKCNRLLLSWILVHMLHVVQLEKRNKMNLQNVCIILSPAMQMSHRVLQTFFSCSHILFKGVEIQKYVPPIEPDSSRLSLELPDSPRAIEEELSKQETLLNVIHEELNKGLRDAKREEQLWEVQRVVTQLKRKLRFLRQVMCDTKQQMDDTGQDNEGQKNNLISMTLYRKLEDQSMNVLKKSDCEITEHTASRATEDATSASGHCKEINGHISSAVHSEVAIKRGDQLFEKGSAEIAHEKVSTSEEITDDFCKEEVSKIGKDEITNGITGENPEIDMSNASIDHHQECVSLQREQVILIIQEEELLLLGDELQRKINSEKLEIERLKQEIAEYQQFFKYRVFSLDSTENSSSESDESSSEADENDDLAEVLKELFKKNEFLEKLNKDLSQNIQKEREACLDLKVRMKMAQKELYMQL